MWRTWSRGPRCRHKTLGRCSRNGTELLLEWVNIDRAPRTGRALPPLRRAPLPPIDSGEQIHSRGKPGAVGGRVLLHPTTRQSLPPLISCIASHGENLGTGVGIATIVPFVAGRRRNGRAPVAGVNLSGFRGPAPEARSVPAVQVVQPDRLWSPLGNSWETRK